MSIVEKINAFPSMAKSDANKTLIIACILFFCLGSAIAVVGPVLPALAENSQTTLANIGTIFTAIFLGALMAMVVSGPLSDRLGQPVVIFTGIFLITMGIFGFSLLRSLVPVLISAFLTGLGHGAVDLSANVLISRVFASRNVFALNMLNLFFGVGAFAGPACVSLVLSLGGSGLIILWINACVFLFMAPFVIRMKKYSLGPAPIEKNGTGNSVYRSSMVWMLGFMILIYVGIENGIGGWITTYVNRTTALNLDASALASAGFWGAITLGRLVTAFLGTRFSAVRILLTSLICSTFGGFFFAFSTGSEIPTILAVLITGFSFGAIYPTTIAIITTTFNSTPGKAASIAATMGSLGGMLIPWLQGIILVDISPNASAWFAAVMISLMIIVFGLSLKIKK